MGVIIYIPKGKTIKKEELVNAWNRNHDGASITYLKNNTIHVKKGYMNFNEFYKDCKELIFDDTLERILHFRLTTMGTTSPEQTHPYPISQNIRDLKGLDYTTNTPVAMMNGTIFSIEPEEGLNDIMTYIKDQLYQYKGEITSLMKILNEEWSKWAVITPEEVFLTDYFLEENGIYYSNIHHRPDIYGEWENLKDIRIAKKPQKIQLEFKRKHPLPRKKKRTRPKNDSQYYQDSLTMEAEENYKEAINYCKKAISLKPNNRKYKNKLLQLKKQLAKKEYQNALILEKEGKYKEALEIMKKIIEDGFN